MRKLREIIMPHGMRTKLQKDTGISGTTIRLALKGVIDTEASRLVRKRAIEMGGVYCK